MERGEIGMGSREKERKEDRKTALNKRGSIASKVALFFLILVLSSGLLGCNKYSNYSKVTQISESSSEKESDDNSTNEPATVSKDGLTMEIQYGFDHFTKYGRYMNISVNVTSTTSDLKGNLQIILPDYYENNVMYQKYIEVKAGDKKQISFPVPMRNSSNNVFVKIVDEEEKELLSKKIKFNVTSYSSKEFVGILSDDYSGLSYFSNSYTKTFYLDKEDISTESKGLDSLDVLVINDFDTSQLSEKQYTTIKEWVKDGGTLVLGTGENQVKTMAMFQDDFLSYNILGEEVIETTFGMDNDDLENLKQELEESEKKQEVAIEEVPDQSGMKISQDNNMLEDSFDTYVDEKTSDSYVFSFKNIEKTMMNIKLQDSKLLVSEDGNVLMQQVVKGKGVVDVISFDLSLESQVWNSIGNTILSEVRDSYSTIKKEQLKREGTGNNSSWGIYSTLGYATSMTSRVPKVMPYIIVLLIYVVFIGPVLYLLLKRKDLRSFTWIAVPLCAIIFTGIVYSLGRNTRVLEPYVGYVSFATIEDNKVNENLYFSITAPYNQEYTFHFNQPYKIQNLLNENNSYYMGDDNKNESYKVSISYGANDTMIKMKNYASFTPTYYNIEETKEWDGELVSSLSYSDYSLSGTIVNHLGIDLEYSALLSNHTLINIGDLESGESVDVSDKESKYLLSSTAIYYEKDFLSRSITKSGSDSKDMVEKNMRENMINYLVEYYGFSDENKSYLVGFTTSDINSGIINNLGVERCGIQVVIIPVEVDYQNENYELVPFIDKYMTVVEGNYSGSYRYMDSETLVCRYDFDKGDKIVSIEYPKELNSEFDTDTWNGFSGEVYFYNIETNEYDLIFESDKKGKCTDLSEYLDQKNSILVKYVVEGQYAEYSNTLPYLSVLKEVK